MRIKVKFRMPQIYMVFITPAILIHFRRYDAPSDFIFGISIDWLWWQIGVVFLKQKGETK